MTYQDIKGAHFRNIGKAGQFADAVLLDDFNYNLGARYQQIMGSLSRYINQDTLTASTVANQQYYYYPVGTVGVDSAYITVGTAKVLMTTIYDTNTWTQVNTWPVTSSYPLFIFPRKDDFGIWPVPSGINTITFSRFFRDRNLLVDDYSTGTVALTNASTTITGTGTVFTQAMAGRWFTVTDTATPGQGYWYRVASVSNATSLELETVWAGPTTASTTYRVGEVPEIPSEGHVMLPAGTAADFYAGLRADPVKATWWNNVFWTGDGNNNVRDFASKNVTAGLIGLINKYKDRDRDTLVSRESRVISPTDRLFSQFIF